MLYILPIFFARITLITSKDPLEKKIELRWSNRLNFFQNERNILWVNFPINTFPKMKNWFKTSQFFSLPQRAGWDDKTVPAKKTRRKVENTGFFIIPDIWEWKSRKMRILKKIWKRIFSKIPRDYLFSFLLKIFHFFRKFSFWSFFIHMPGFFFLILSFFMWDCHFT